MSVLFFQLRAAVTTLLFGIWHLVSFPWSRRSRWRSARLLSACQDPFVLERIPLSAVLPDPFVVTLGPLKAEEHNTSEYELVCLASLVKAGGVKRVFEIGTFDGRSTRAMAMNLPSGGKLLTLNLPPGEERNAAGVRNVDSTLNTKVTSGFRFLGTPEAARIDQLFGDSATFDFSPHAGQMDLVFIDGSHELDYVTSDTAAALRLIKPSGGWIVWHDASLYGVAPYLSNQIRNAGWPIRLIEGTTLMLGYCVNGRMTALPIDKNGA
jgi:predicted O-methyltransferase YrrM